MNNQLSSTAPAITAGLIMAQVIGTLQVGWSNRLLSHRMSAVVDAGYVAVPTDLIVPSFQSARAALGGGLFFTLTIGAFITIFTVGCLRLWAQGLNRPKTGIGLIAIICVSTLGVIIYHGFHFFLAAYFFFVPFAVCVAYPWGGVRIGAGRRAAGVGKNDLVYTQGCMKWRRNAFLFHAAWLLLPLIILVLMGRSFFGPRMFFDIRDRILLSNPAGRLANDFYYRYTLYPAESFKSLAQKQVRTFRWIGPDGGVNKKIIIHVLVKKDYLPMPIGGDPDVMIESLDADRLMFRVGDQTMRIKVTDFLDRPSKMLQHVSDASDNHRFLRRLTYVSLVVGFPLLVYLMAHGLVRRMAGWLFSARFGTVTASVACLLMGVAILWILTSGRPESISEETLPDFVSATDGRHRVAALKMMERRRIDPSQFEAYAAFLKSPRIVERYWVARALAHGRGEKIDLDLIRMLKDPSPNVVCMVLKSLGKRGDSQVIPLILDLMKRSNHWYVQWHAYNALKRLGWRQHVSN